MRSELNYVYGFLLLLVLGFSSWYYMRDSHPKPLPADVLQIRPDAIANNITTYQYNNQGQRISRVKADKLIHYPKNNTSLFINPDVIYRQAGKQPWHVVAKRGKAIDGTEKIILWDQVRMKQTGDKQHPPSTITTSKMIFYPKKKYAETNKTVTYRQPGIILHSIGIKAYLDQDRVLLLHQAKVTYDSKKAKLHKLPS